MTHAPIRVRAVQQKSQLRVGPDVPARQLGQGVLLIIQVSRPALLEDLSHQLACVRLGRHLLAKEALREKPRVPAIADDGDPNLRDRDGQAVMGDGHAVHGFDSPWEEQTLVNGGQPLGTGWIDARARGCIAREPQAGEEFLPDEVPEDVLVAHRLANLRLESLQDALGIEPPFPTPEVERVSERFAIRRPVIIVPDEDTSLQWNPLQHAYSSSSSLKYF